DDLVWAVLSVDHRDWAKETLAADVLFTEIAETDPRLTDVATSAVMDPGAHGWGTPPCETIRAVRGPKATLILAADHRQWVPSSTVGIPAGLGCKAAAPDDTAFGAGFAPLRRHLCHLTCHKR